MKTLKKRKTKSAFLGTQVSACLFFFFFFPLIFSIKTATIFPDARVKTLNTEMYDFVVRYRFVVYTLPSYPSHPSSSACSQSPPLIATYTIHPMKHHQIIPAHTGISGSSLVHCTPSLAHRYIHRHIGTFKHFKAQYSNSSI